MQTLPSKFCKIGLWPFLVFSRVENWDRDVRTIGTIWSKFKENYTECSSWSSIIRQWKRWSRIETVRVKIIRESGESSIAEKTEKEFPMLQKMEKNNVWFGYVHQNLQGRITWTFFSREMRWDISQQKCRTKLSGSVQPRETVDTLHLMRHRCVAISTNCPLQTKERDMANERPRHTRGWSTTSISKLVPSCAAALASADHLPPTSRARTTKWALARGHQLPVGLLFAPPGLGQGHTVRGCCSLSWFSTATNRGHKCSVHCQLHSSVQRQAVDDHFQAPVVSSHKHPQIHISHKHVRHDSAPSFPADSGGRETPPSQSLLEHAARWWPKGSSGRPHPQMRWDKGRGRWRRRWRSTGTKLSRFAGVESWDKQRRRPHHTAHSVTSTVPVPGLILGIRISVRKLDWILIATACCHPCRGTSRFPVLHFHDRWALTSSDRWPRRHLQTHPPHWGLWQPKCQSVVNTSDITLKKMFHTSTRLVFEQNENWRLETIGWKIHGSARRSSSFRV